MAFGVAPVQADRPARPDWDAGEAGLRFAVPAAALLAVLGVHALPLELMDALQALATQGEPVDVITHGESGPVQVLLGGRRHTLAREAGEAVHRWRFGRIASPAGLPAPQGAVGAVTAPPSTGTDPSDWTRASLVDAQMQRARAQPLAPERVDPETVGQALARAYSA